MRSIIKHAFVILVLALLVQASSWAVTPAGVQVSWADANGPHNIGLTLDINPEYNSGDPLSVEKWLAWQGDIDVVMTDNLNPIVFTVTGNFSGPTDPMNPNERLWYQVRLNQHVLNHTSRPWDQFDLSLSALDPDPNPSRYASFYNVHSWSPSEWSVFLDDTNLSYYPENPNVGPFVPVGGTFFDVAKIYSDLDLTTGDGGFILTKTAHLSDVPEPGSVVALSCGLIGFIGLIRRPKN